MLKFLVGGLLTVSAMGQIAPTAPSDKSATQPSFQVATIKPSRPDEPRTMMIRGSQFLTTGTSLVDLLKYAYGLHENEFAGGAEWLKTQKFDMVADAETQTRPTSDEFKRMVQELLRDRFHLTAHRETRDLSVFEIVPAKSGPKLTRSKRPPDDIPAVAYVPGQLSAADATMADLATFLQRFVTDRPVFDATGIMGKYDLTLRWTPDELPAGPGSRDGDANSSLPGLFTAIQEQLGLKLQERRRPSQVLVIDRVDMPSEN